MQQQLQRLQAQQQLLDQRLRLAIARFAPCSSNVLSCSRCQKALSQAIRQRLQQPQQRWQLLLARLDTVSPLATLARGYSISFDAQQQVLTEASQLQPGQQVHTRLAQGSFVAEVKATTP